MHQSFTDLELAYFREGEPRTIGHKPQTDKCQLILGKRGIPFKLLIVNKSGLSIKIL